MTWKGDMESDKLVGSVIVTGGLGFIGTHVADAYLAAGHSVILIDSEVAAVVDGKEYEAHPRCHVVREPVETYFSNDGCLEGVSRVVHAASHVGPAGILRYAGQLGAEMVNATKYVIERCIQADVPLCVFSSAEIYGRSGLLAEEDDIRVPTPYNTRIEYAIAKTLIEAMMVNSLHRGLRAIAIRPFNVVGPRQSRAGGFVMPTFVQQAIAGDPITVFDSGEQVRAFTSASDLSRFLTDFWDEALESEAHIFNIGNPANRTTVLELAERVKTLLGSDSEIIYVDAKRIYGPMYMEAESFEKVPVLKAAREVGWEPDIDLDQLILETASYYRDRADYRQAREESLRGTHASL